MEKWLRRCLSSLIASDDRLLRCLEVLVICDGSTDGSNAIAAEYASRWPETFRVIEKENGQYGSCVNRALDEAQGRYFRMLDADDWMNTEALASLLQQLTEGNIVADLVVTKFTRYAPTGIITHRNEPVRLEYGRTYDISELVTFMHEVWPSSYVMHNMTYRTDLLRQMHLRLTEGIYYSDTEYCFYPLYHLQSATFLDLDLYQYDVSREGQTTQLDVAYRHRHQLFLLVKQCVSYYLNEREAHTADFNQMARLLLMFLIKALYMATCLGHTHDDDGHDRNLLREADALLGQDPDLYYFTTQRYYNLLPYVRLVRATGCWPNTGLWGCYNRMVNTIKHLAGYKNKNYD